MVVTKLAEDPNKRQDQQIGAAQRAKTLVSLTSHQEAADDVVDLQEARILALESSKLGQVDP